MVLDAIEQEFRQKVAAKVRLEPEGLHRFRVFTPFQFEDGDHLVIVLKEDGEHWFLSDEGHTYMHLTYGIDERSLRTGTRQKIIASALNVFSVEDRSGELVLPIEEGRYGDALYSFIQALLKVSDVTFLTQERVRSAFLEDFRAYFEEHVPAERRSFDWCDPVHDLGQRYPIDCRIQDGSRPLFVFALPSDEKVQTATIILHQFKDWHVPFRSLGVFQKQEDVNRKYLARFSDVCDKQFSNLYALRDQIQEYLEEYLREH